MIRFPNFRGLSELRDFYRQALSLEFPSEVAALLERQADSVSDAYDQICTLRDMRGKAAWPPAA